MDITIITNRKALITTILQNWYLAGIVRQDELETMAVGLSVYSTYHLIEVLLDSHSLVPSNSKVYEYQKQENIQN